MNVRLLQLLVLLGVLVGCEHAEQPAIPALSELPGTSSGAPPRINGDVGAPRASPPAEVSYGAPGDVTLPGSATTSEAGDISLDFADTDIREVATQILGNILKLNYTIDPAVHGAATLRTVRPLARTQLLSVLQSLLAQNGAALVQSGSLYRVRASRAGSRCPGIRRNSGHRRCAIALCCGRGPRQGAAAIRRRRWQDSRRPRAQRAAGRRRTSGKREPAGSGTGLRYRYPRTAICTRFCRSTPAM